jgi:hypothetical protein
MSAAEAARIPQYFNAKPPRLGAGVFFCAKRMDNRHPMFHIPNAVT